MSYAEDILKLRKRVNDAVLKGVVTNDGKDFLEAALIQVMNEAERNRQNCLTNAENLRKQAATFEGQAGAFASVSSIVFNVINGFVAAAERDEAERAEQERQRAEIAALEDESKAEASTETSDNLSDSAEKKGRKKRA